MNAPRLRALLVDDEEPARDRMRRLLKAHPEVEVAGEASNGLEALERCEELRPDLLFLDIQMPELDGLSVARSIRQDSPPAVIFSTAFDEHALAAFDAAAIDYLVKPIRPERLARVIARAAAHVRARAPRAPTLPPPNRLAIRSGAKYLILELASVHAVVARDHYSCVLSEGRELLADDSLDSLEPRLQGAGFLRVHRGAIVNLEWVRELKREGDRKYSAVLKDPSGTRLPVSRERLDAVRGSLGIRSRG